VTSVALAAELGGVKKNTREQLQVKFSRDLRLADLKQSDVILVGAEQTNPWLHLFRPRLNFHLDWDSNEDRFRILNDHPSAGELAEWPWSRDDTSHRGFGQIAFLPNLSGNGYVLIIAGTSMDGTQAAKEFLFDPKRSNSILELAEKKGKPFGGFEVLLQAQVLDHGTVGSTVLGTRYYPLPVTP
jgi:hypothetical protein